MSDGEILAHRYILTPIGNVIEATADPDHSHGSTYKENVNSSVGLHDFVLGSKIVTSEGMVYGGNMSSVEAEKARLEARDISHPEQAVVIPDVLSLRYDPDAAMVTSGSPDEQIIGQEATSGEPLSDPPSAQKFGVPVGGL